MIKITEYIKPNRSGKTTKLVKAFIDDVGKKRYFITCEDSLISIIEKVNKYDVDKGIDTLSISSALIKEDLFKQIKHLLTNSCEAIYIDSPYILDRDFHDNLVNEVSKYRKYIDIYYTVSSGINAKTYDVLQ